MIDSKPVSPILASLHIQVRLVCLLVFGALLPWQGTSGLVAGGVALVALLAASGREGMKLLGALRRIRWLLFSLAVLYLGFTPGEPLLPAIGDWSPSRLGLVMLLERSLVLVLMLLAALLVMRSSTRAELLAGMRRILSPLSHLHLVPERFPERFALLFHEIDAIEGQVRKARQDRSPFMVRASHLWQSLERGEVATMEAAPEPPGVPMWQWIIPILILAGGIAGLPAGA